MALVNRDQIFVATTGTLLSSGTTTDLGIGQLGFFDSNTYVATTTPVSTSIIIGQGTSDEPLNVGTFQSNSTDKTPVISGKSVTGWRAYKAQRAQNGIVTLGYDGVDVTKTLTLNKGEIKKFWVRLSGTGVDYLMGGTSDYIKEEFTIGGDCVSDCTDNCNDPENCSVVLNKVISALKDRKIVGGNLLVDQGTGKNGLIKVTGLTKCTTPSGYTTVSCEKWTLTKFDAGTFADLGVVQSQYPGVKVALRSHIDATSVYELTVCDGSTPANFVSNGNNTIPNCTTCPSGYALIAAAYQYTATKSGIQVSTAANGATGYVVGSGVILGTAGAGGSTTIQFYSTNATLATVAASIPTFVVTKIGDVESICDGNSGASTAWVADHACTKAKTYFYITLKNPECGGTNLAALQAIYGATVVLVTNNTDTCTSQYELTVTSDNPSCVDCGDQSYTFTAPAPFQGTTWTEVDGTITGTGCVCGVKFESAYVSRKRAFCYFDEVPYVTEPIFIEVSQFPFDQVDASALCEENWAVTVVRSAKYAAGNGSFIADFEKLSKYYFNKPWRSDAAERNVLGYEFNSDFDSYYDQFALTFNVNLPQGYSGTSTFRTYEWSFYIPEANGVAFQNAVNGFLAANQSQVPPVSI